MWLKNVSELRCQQVNETTWEGDDELDIALLQIKQTLGFCSSKLLAEESF